MHVLSEYFSLKTCLETIADGALDGAISRFIQRFSECGYCEWEGLLRFIVVEPGDTARELDDVLGFSIMENRFNGLRFGDPGFNPSWEFVGECGRWYEIVYVLSDDGAGVVAFVDKQGDYELIQMLKFYAARQ